MSFVGKKPIFKANFSRVNYTANHSPFHQNSGAQMKKIKGPLAQKPKMHKKTISINNINVRTNNINLNASNLNFSHFTKNMISNLRDQFNEITNQNQRQIKVKTNKNSLNTSFNYASRSKEKKENSKDRNIYKYYMPTTDSNNYETENASILDSYEEEKKEIENKYNNLVIKFRKTNEEKDKLNSQIKHYKKTIDILKNIVIIEKEKLEQMALEAIQKEKIKCKEEVAYYQAKSEELLKQNCELKQCIFKMFDGMKLFDEENTKSNNEIFSILSQLVKENENLRKISKILSSESTGLNTKKAVQKNNQKYIDVLAIGQGTQNYTGHFGNSNIYLNKTMKKEMIDNLNVTCIHEEKCKKNPNLRLSTDNENSSGKKQRKIQLNYYSKLQKKKI